MKLSKISIILGAVFAAIALLNLVVFRELHSALFSLLIGASLFLADVRKRQTGELPLMLTHRKQFIISLVLMGLAMAMMLAGWLGFRLTI